MANLYTGSINTNGEYVNLAELTGLTFTKDTVYAIQIQNVAWLREGTDGQGFLFNRDKGYLWKCMGDDLYIRTTLADTIVNIAENSGFFLNKSGGGGGSTAKNTAIIQKDNVVREVSSKVQGKVPDTYNFTQTGGTLNTDNNTYTGALNAMLTLSEIAPLSTAENWEFQTKYTYKAGGSAGRAILGYTGGSSNDCKCPVLLTTNAGVLRTYISSNGTSWDINNTVSSLTMQENQIYYIKLGFDGTGYYIDYNQTGWEDTFTRVWSTVNSTKCYCNVTNALMNSTYNSNYYSAGSMGLEDTKYIINSQLWWQAVTKGSDWQNL